MTGFGPGSLEQSLPVRGGESRGAGRPRALTSLFPWPRPSRLGHLCSCCPGSPGQMQTEGTRSLPGARQDRPLAQEPDGGLHVGRGRVKPEPSGPEQSCAASPPLWPDSTWCREPRRLLWEPHRQEVTGSPRTGPEA